MRRGFTESQKAQAILKRTAGESIASIMAATGLTRWQVKTLTAHIPQPDGGWKRNRKSQLSEEHKTEILRLVHFMSYRSIADKLGVTHNAVAHFMRKNKPPEGWNLPKRSNVCKLTPDQKKQIRKCREAGETQQSIADRYGVSSITIHHIVKDMQQVKRPRRSTISDMQLSDIVARRMACEPLQSIAQRYGVSAPYLHKITKSFMPADGWPLLSKNKTKLKARFSE